eukprot:scaffold14122_cov22-Tisochrysis_lutea.AAC.1
MRILDAGAPTDARLCLTPCGRREGGRKTREGERREVINEIWKWVLEDVRASSSRGGGGGREREIGEVQASKETRGA